MRPSFESGSLLCHAQVYNDSELDHRIYFGQETGRLESLARGHMAQELGDPCIGGLFRAHEH